MNKLRRRWTLEEIAYLETNYPIMSASKMAVNLVRTSGSIKKQLGALGIYKHGEKPEKRTESLCFDCKNHYFGCSKEKNLAQAKGWKTKPSEIYENGFLVVKCPDFEKDKRKPKPAEPVAPQQSLDLEQSPCRKCYSEKICSKNGSQCRLWEKWMKKNHVWERTVGRWKSRERMAG